MEYDCVLIAGKEENISRHTDTDITTYTEIGNFTVFFLVIGHSVPAVLQSTFHAQACEELFKHLCISGTPKIRLHTGLLLVQLCGGERWWGQFLSNVLQELYNSEQLLIFPQDR